MHEPLGFVRDFRNRLQAAGIRHAITSGLACVYFGLQQTTKDTDWLIDPAHIETLRKLLATAQQQLPRWRVTYRTVFGAPMDAAWMRHGWTCHIAIQTDATCAEHHLDFFARPPRVPSWHSDAHGFAGRDVVARMKRTDRDKDWPFVDGLGWQIAEQEGDPAAAVLHVQQPERLRSLWQQLTPDQRTGAVRHRPLLNRIAEADTDALEGWIRLERLLWQNVNRERYGRYQQSWKDFYRRWRVEPDWSWPTNEDFGVQHRRLLAAAHIHGLDVDPLAGHPLDQLLARAQHRTAAIAFAPVEAIRSVTPPCMEMLP